MTIRTPNNSYYVSGASGGQNHTLPFGADRFEDDDLFVYVWNASTEVWDKKTVTTHYTVSSTQVSFTSSHIPSTRVIVLRKTDVDEDFPKADFVAGASIKAQDLDNNQMQALRGIKELRDQKLSAVPSIAEDGTPSNPKMYANLDMNGYKVINQPAGHVTSTDILDGTIATADLADSAITTAKITDSAVTTAKIAADAVNGTKIADDSIDSEHYVDGSIDTAHIADSQVTTAKIADTNVTTAKIADNAVTAAKIPDSSLVSAKYANQSVGTAALADSNVTTAKIADANITTAKLADANVTTAKIAADAIDGSKLADNAVDSEHYTDGSIDTVHIGDAQVTTAKIADGSITSAKLNGATVVTNSEHSASTPNDTSFFTTSASDDRYFRQDSTETITSGVSWTSDNARVATTGAIDARIIDLVEEVGGFVPIANETSFPTANPDVNDGAGTIVSVSAIGTTRTPSSGTVTIANGAGSGNTVTITGVGTQELTSGFGMLVETTTTLHTYTFHRLTPPATNVNTVATNITNVNTVAGNNANVTTVAGIDSDVTTVANNNANVTTVAGSIANVNTAAGSIANINTVAADLNEATSEIDTVATNIANVNAVGNDITNVNTVASNINSVNSFSDVYRIAASDPTTSLNVGDLVFNTTNNALRVYNGTSWQDGVTASGNFMSKTGDAMSGNLNMQTNKIENVGDATANGDAVSKSFMDSAIDTALTGDVIGGQSITVTDNSPASGQISIAVTGSSIGTTQLAADAVTGAKIADDAVGAEHIEVLDANLQFADSAKAQFGTSQDLEIYHDGSTNIVDGRFHPIELRHQSEVHVKCVDDGAVELYHNNNKKFETTSSGATVSGSLNLGSGDLILTGNVDLEDSTGAGNNRIKVGASDDLQIYHDGSTSYIEDAGTGGLDIRSNEVKLSTDHGETLAVFSADGSCSLRNNNAIKLQTKSDGVDITGELQCDSLDVDGVAAFTGGTASFGNSSSGFSGTPIFAYANTTASNQGTIQARNFGSGGANFIGFDGGGNATSYINTDGSASFSGNVTLEANLDLQDNDNIFIGTGDDLQLYHTGSTSFIDNVNGGLSIRQLANDQDILLTSDNGSGGDTAYVRCDGSAGAVRLYNYGSEKLTTLSTGVDITGELQCDTLDVDGAASFTGGDVDFNGANHQAFWDYSQSSFRFQDSATAEFGNGEDLRIYHDGTHSRIDNQTNDLILRNQANDRHIYLQTDDGSGGTTTYLQCSGSNGEVSLHHYGTQMLNTKSDGVNISGELECDSLDVDGAGDFTGDVAFRGGVGAVNITAGSDIRFESGTWTGNTTSPKIQGYNNKLYILGGSDGIVFRENDTDRAFIDGSGHFRPSLNNTYDLGTSSARWRNVYTNDLNLSNEGSANDVDGTWGNYTIQEGEDDLFLINRRNGKKYKFNLTEVN